MKRTDLHKIMIIGSGPIVIGQACEFDYSGTQACRALKEEGYEIVLVNSNPATIMTDPATADHIYIEPLSWEVIANIIDQERPDALLATLGGQTALNLATELAENGVLDQYGVELIGASVEVIERAESRELFKKIAQEVGLEVAKSFTVNTLEDAKKVVQQLGYPCVIRPSYTLGGTGGGIVFNEQEFLHIAEQGLTNSLTTEILVEESLLGWKEYEMEVVRDKKDNVIIVCSMENVDPMGVHTGDSITVAPAQTLTNREFQLMRTASIDIIRAIGVETGGCNVQFAINPRNGRMIVIEVNPRVSRSSALASKATGYPIAKFAAKLAVGYTLDELQNDITRKNACFEPTIDYCVVKIPRFNFNKFPQANPTLGTAMKAVGEVMAIGRTFKEAFQKGMRSLELKEVIPANTPLDTVIQKLKQPTAKRLWYIQLAFKLGLSVDEVYSYCKIDPWFLFQMRQLVTVEKEHEQHSTYKHSLNGSISNKQESKTATVNNFSPTTTTTVLADTVPIPNLRNYKEWGFSDKQLATFFRETEINIRAIRKEQGVLPTYKLVDTCAGEFEAYTPYYYSTYEQEDESIVSNRPKVMVIGSGPNRIGQGIEFDYCCVHAAFAAKALDYEVIMVNSNPETVSTDFDVSDKLYFEPITFEDILNIYEKEQPQGIILQFGGQTPLNLAAALAKAGATILGTSPKSIHEAEDRDAFQQLCHQLNLRQPVNAIAYSLEEMLSAMNHLQYPVIVRPSHVLGGAKMKIIDEETGLKNYAEQEGVSYPILIEAFLEDAIEIDVDALSDGSDCVIAAIMEHVEPTGVHSGDSACVLPTYSISEELLAQIKTATKQLAKSLQIIGLMNIQFAIKDEQLYIIEVNPRASRTVPFVSKATGIPWAKLATQVILGKKVTDLVIPTSQQLGQWAVKEVVFPFNKFAGIDIALSPEMKSTGEVMGTDTNLGLAFYKAQWAVGTRLPIAGKVLASIPNNKQDRFLPLVKELQALGFDLTFVSDIGAEKAAIQLQEKEYQLFIQVIGTGEITAVSSLSRLAYDSRVPVITTLRATTLAVQAIKSYQSVGGKLSVKALVAAV